MNFGGKSADNVVSKGCGRQQTIGSATEADRVASRQGRARILVWRPFADDARSIEACGSDSGCLLWLWRRRQRDQG